MPKRVACQFKCDRCGAIWLEDYSSNEPEPEAPSVKLSLSTPVGDGVRAERVVSFDVLCEKCVSTIKNYIDHIDRDPDARRKPRAKKKSAPLVAAEATSKSAPSSSS